MCFSAPVSFIAAGGLGGIGVASFRKVRGKDWLLAAIPLFFAFQQGMEGIQWLVDAPSVLSTFAAYGFLFVALILWPTYIPFTVLKLDSKRKRFMQFCLVLGLATSVYFLWYLLMNPVLVAKLGPGIAYGLGATPLLVVIGYTVSVIVSLLISSIRFFRFMGVLVGGSAIATTAFFSAPAFASVWCFFAAILCTAIYFYLAAKKRR
jgi:hypothetical protein